MAASKYTSGDITVSFKKGKNTLTILKKGKPVGGFIGPIISSKIANKIGKKIC